MIAKAIGLILDTVCIVCFCFTIAKVVHFCETAKLLHKKVSKLTHF